MKTLICLFLYVFTALAIVIWATPAEANNECMITGQVAAYCGGKYPPIKDATDEQLQENANKLNACTAHHGKTYDELVVLYQKHYRAFPDLTQIYTDCSKISYDPHFLNMDIMYSCVDNYIMDKLKM